MYKHVFASVYKCVCLHVCTVLHEPYTLYLMCTVGTCTYIHSLIVYTNIPTCTFVGGSSTDHSEQDGEHH